MMQREFIPISPALSALGVQSVKELHTQFTRLPGRVSLQGVSSPTVTAQDKKRMALLKSMVEQAKSEAKMGFGELNAYHFKNLLNADWTINNVPVLMRIP